MVSILSAQCDTEMQFGQFDRVIISATLDAVSGLMLRTSAFLHLYIVILLCVFQGYSSGSTRPAMPCGTEEHKWGGNGHKGGGERQVGGGGTASGGGALGQGKDVEVKELRLGSKLHSRA